MPTDTGRTWDALMRRHWKGLWSPGQGRQAVEARAAFKAFLRSVHEELSFHRKAIDEVRHAESKAAESAPAPKSYFVASIPAEKPGPFVAAAVLEPQEREAIERALGHRFQKPRLLEEALAHPTFIQENPELGLPSNYRLAFLGDALLGFLVADALHGGLPEADQRVLTERRKHLVSRPALGRTAERLGLGPHLLVGRQLHEGRKNPTILAETLEALLAAIYLDGGPDEARAFVQRNFSGELKAPSPRPASGPSRGRRRPRRR